MSKWLSFLPGEQKTQYFALHVCITASRWHGTCDCLIGARLFRLWLRSGRFRRARLFLRLIRFLFLAFLLVNSLLLLQDRSIVACLWYVFLCLRSLTFGWGAWSSLLPYRLLRSRLCYFNFLIIILDDNSAASGLSNDSIGANASDVRILLLTHLVAFLFSVPFCRGNFLFFVWKSEIVEVDSLP